MPLFQIQDDDRPMYIVASDLQQAVQKWREVLDCENPDDDCSGTQPQGIIFLASDDDLIADRIVEITDKRRVGIGRAAKIRRKIPLDTGSQIWIITGNARRTR